MAKTPKPAETSAQDQTSTPPPPEVTPTPTETSAQAGLEQEPVTNPEESPPEDLSREVTLERRPTTIRLDQIDRDKLKQVYCHRSSEELTGDSTQSLVESLVSEGQLTPIEYYRDRDGAAILVRGYRTVEAHHQIIERKLDPEHFNPNMMLPADELVGGTE